MTIERRIEALERSARRSRLLAIVAVAVAGLSLASGSGRAAPDVIEARGFVVRDDNGTMRAFLGTKDRGRGAGLSVYDAQGNHVIGLASAQTGAFLDLANAGVATRLGAMASGGGLTVTDAAGRRRLVAGVDSAGAPSVARLDPDGQPLP